MRGAMEYVAVTSAISLGLIATRLRRCLLGINKEVGFECDKLLLERLDSILNQTIDFIDIPRKPTTVGTTSQVISSRFLARAGYLEQLRSAAPPPKNKTPKGLSAYLRKISLSLKELKKGKTLRSPQKEELDEFLKAVTRGCIEEATKLQQARNPKESHESVLKRARYVGTS